tara:strand:- start:3061 stop:3663 length:603 start_codon:yes stop_codon:yes gene_type:complete
VKSDNVLILTVARCASTFYQHHIAIERKIKNLGEQMIVPNKSVVKVRLDKFFMYPDFYFPLLDSCEVHILFPRNDLVDHMLSNIIPLYKNSLAELEEREAGETWWNIRPGKTTKTDVLSHFDNIKVPYSFVLKCSSGILFQLKLLNQWTRYDYKTSFDEVIKREDKWKHKIFDSFQSKLKYLEEPEKTIEYLEKICNSKI